MIERGRLKNVVIFVQTILSFVLSRRITSEKQVNKEISFLDVLITNDGDQFCTSVFCKETAVSLFTTYLSFTPFSYNVGLVRTSLHHTFMISSSWFLFDEKH